MAAERASGLSGPDARLRMMCSHGGRFLPSGPDGAIRYAGGETRVLVVPREASFGDLVAKLAAMAGGEKTIVSVVRYRLADDDDVLVSATCDEELAHMRDEYDRLKATRPSAIFRLFFSVVQVQRRAASGRPPLAPKIRRVQSEHALASLRPCAAGPVPMRRVQSAHQLAGCSRFQPCCYCRCRRHFDQYAPVPVPQAAPPTSKNARGARPAGQEERAPQVSGAKPADRVISTTQAAMEKISGEAELEEPNRRAFWEFE